MHHPSIYIVAGPRSCGKSTFIERCKTRSGLTLPSELSGLIDAHGPVYFMELADQVLPDDRDLLVHVDLVTPFADLLISSEQALASRLHAKAFSEFPGAELFKNCAELKVLTLRIPRTTTLRRWLRRSAEQGRDTVRTVMAQLYSDAMGETGYSALYDAWDRYTASLPNATTWNVLESSETQNYSLVRA